MPCTFMQDFFSLSVLKHISICVIDLSAVFENKKNIVLMVRKHLKFCNTTIIFMKSYEMFSKYFDWFYLLINLF